MSKGDRLSKITKAVKDFHSEYINSPKYAERLKKQGYSNVAKVISDRLASMKATRVIDNPYVGTEYHYKDPKNRIVTFNKEQAAGYNDDGAVLAHEFSHSAGGLEIGQEANKNLNLNKKDAEELTKRNIFSKLSAMSIRNLPIEQQARIWHEQKPSENKAYLDAVRFMMKRDGIYDAGKEDFNKDKLKKMKQVYKKSPMAQFLLNNYKDDDVIWLMNNIAKSKNNNEQNIA